MSLPLALLALVALGAAAGRAGREAEETGRFFTPERHRCSWKLRTAAEASELRLKCRPSTGGGEAQSCAYLGEPRRCPAYGARSRQYWRQILGQLRRRQHPCAPGGPLSARLCGPGRAPPEAQLRLLPGPVPGPSPPATTAEPTADPTETYCAERWHSLCSFFVGFWEG